MKRGRPKGYSPYVDITYDELGDWVGRKSMVRVSKAWLEALTAPPAPSSPISKVKTLSQDPETTDKIEYKLVNLNE